MALTARQKHFICKRLAQFDSIPKVIKAFEDVFGEKLYNSRVIYYRDSPTWAKLIQDLRDAWNEKAVDEIMSSKRIRLQRLDEVYTEAMKQAFAGCDKFGNEKYTFSPMGAVAALKQAQEETEGRKVRLAGHDGQQLKLSLTDRLAALEADGGLDDDPEGAF